MAESRAIQYQAVGARGWGQIPEPEISDYDWVINKLRARGFKTLQDRKAEAEEQRRKRLEAWEEEKRRREDAGEDMRGKDISHSNDPSWWSDLKALPEHFELPYALGAEKKEGPPEMNPLDLMTEEQKEEKRIRDKWGGTLAENFPLSDLKIIADTGYIPRSQATCFRCGEKGHWSRDCPQAAMKASDNILDRNRRDLDTRDRKHYDKARMNEREREHYTRPGR